MALAVVTPLASCQKPATKPAAEQTPVATTPVAPDGAAAAREVVVRYFELVERGDYAAALALWSEAGQAAVNNDPKVFAEQYVRYTLFHGVAAPAEDAYGGADKDNLVLPATAEVTAKRDGKDRSLRGLVYLRRTRGPAGEVWRIEGVDIRRPANETRRNAVPGDKL